MPRPFPIAARISLSALLGLWLAGAAFAQTRCPTRDDLGQGVRLTRTDPYLSSVYRRDDSGLWETRLLDAGAAGPRALYAHPLAVSRREDAAAALGVIYTDDPADLDHLDRLLAWTSDVTLTRDGIVVAQGVFSVALIGTGEIDIGGCRYAVWNTRDVLVMDDSAPIIFEKYYAPALGLVLRSVRIDLNGDGLSTVVMDQIALE